MKEITILCVIGARPNFVKISPFLRVAREYHKEKKILPVVVHTEQHYDYIMSRIFFQDLDIPRPDIFLGIGSGSHAQQTGKTMMAMEKIITKIKAHLVVVVGDVNSTLGAALSSVKLNIPVAHIEAGLRSFDRRMPEEINRILTDTVSDYLFTTSPEAKTNLLKEGIDPKKIFFVGNIMVDSLFYYLKKAKKSIILSQLHLDKKKYAVLTMHRPSNVDNQENLKKISQALKEIGQEIPIIFPAHPRTQKNIQRFGLRKNFKDRIRIIPPLGYRDFINLMANSRLVFTDSGGIQEETTVLGVPCLTLRENTERPITLTNGTNILVGNSPEKIVQETEKVLKGKMQKKLLPEYWDGQSARRIVNILVEKLSLNVSNCLNQEIVVPTQGEAEKADKVSNTMSN